VEGAAEATASLLKILSGRLTDRLQKRRVFVIAGYALSSSVRPFIALATSWLHVLGLRLVDRVGKGLRTPPRDVMLATVAAPGALGRVFGFHRAMDHTGAIAGPLLASLFLWAAPEQYRLLFLLTIVPGLAVIGLCARLPRDAVVRTPGAAAGASATSWRSVPPAVWALLAVLMVFSLGNSTDAYLLLRFSSLGLSAAAIPLVWALLHVVKAITSLAGGVLADRVGRRPVIACGWIVYACVYAGFARASEPGAAIAWFLLYGLYFGLTEGVERALVADLTPRPLQGTTFGLYNAVVGFGALAASLLFGAVWEWRGPEAAFLLGAALALAATVLLWIVVPARAST
jgi:MFS family permease